MNKPKLLVIINNFPPDLAGGAAVFGDMCQGLAERGFDVSVRCAYPYYPEWRDKSGKNGFKIWRYLDNQVAVERYGLFIPRNTNSLIGRLLHEASFLLSLLRSVGKGRQYDVVMAYCPAVSCLAFGVINKLVWRKPLWLNVQDLAAEAAGASGLVRSNWLGSVLKGIQRWLFNRADVWSTISPIMAEQLAPMRRRSQPLLMLPNWLNNSLSNNIAKARGETSQKPKQAHAVPRLLYAGNIGKKQNLLSLLSTLQKTEASFIFKIHGSGAQASVIEDWITTTADTRFVFGPFLDEAGFAEQLQWSDYFIISETEDGGASFMPSKLIPGISSGTPILAICDASGPLGREVEAWSLGPRLGWSQLSELTAILSPESSGSKNYLTWSENALSRSQDYTRDRVIAQFHAALSSLNTGALPNSDY